MDELVHFLMHLIQPIQPISLGPHIENHRSVQNRPVRWVRQGWQLRPVVFRDIVNAIHAVHAIGSLTGCTHSLGLQI